MPLSKLRLSKLRLSKLRLSKLQLLILFATGIASSLLWTPQSLSTQVDQSTITTIESQIIESQMTIWQAVVLGMVQGWR